MFVELVYDKRNFEGLPGAKEIILSELSKRVHNLFPDADVRVKPMMLLPAINTDASKFVETGPGCFDNAHPLFLQHVKISIIKIVGWRTCLSVTADKSIPPRAEFIFLRSWCVNAMHNISGYL